VFFIFHAVVGTPTPSSAPSTRWGDEGLKNLTRCMVARQRESERYFAALVGIFPETAVLAEWRMLDRWRSRTPQCAGPAAAERDLSSTNFVEIAPSARQAR
jgi:hypothetical protein